MLGETQSKITRWSLNPDIMRQVESMYEIMMNIPKSETLNFFWSKLKLGALELVSYHIMSNLGPSYSYLTIHT